MTDITNAHRITMVCYDPEGVSDDPEELFTSVVGEQDGISLYAAKKFGNPHNHIICEHVASPSDDRLDSWEAKQVFG